MNKLINDFLEYYKTHSGRVKGALIGLIIAIGILTLGFLKTIFIAICVFLGYYIGKQYEMDKNFWRKILNKIFPPGRFR